jgi:hypothetical protein
VPTGRDVVYRFIGLGLGDHTISHQDYQNAKGSRENYETMTRFKVSRFGELVSRLDSHGILDRCIATCFSEMSDGNDHQDDFLPVLVAGAGVPSGHRALGCSTGLLADGIAERLGADSWCKSRDPTPLSNLWLSMLQAVGVPIESFGDSSGSVDLG